MPPPPPAAASRFSRADWKRLEEWCLRGARARWVSPAPGPPRAGPVHTALCGPERNVREDSGYLCLHGFVVAIDEVRHPLELVLIEEGGRHHRP